MLRDFFAIRVLQQNSLRSGHSAFHAVLPLLTQAVLKLFSRPERATLIRVFAVANNNDLRIRNYGVYCGADALPTRVFTQPGPNSDIDLFLSIGGDQHNS